jgi:transposase
MSRLTKIDLTAEQRAALEAAYKHGPTHGFRQRCQMILLKAQKKPARQVAQQLGCCMISVNHWVKRYQSEGIDGLHIRAGRGRKAILCSQQDLPAVRQAVAANRQRLSLAQAQLQKELGKDFSQMTLKRFLKASLPIQANPPAGEASA